jgi:hypothetical protein
MRKLVKFGKLDLWVLAESFYCMEFGARGNVHDMRVHLAKLPLGLAAVCADQGIEVQIRDAGLCFDKNPA